MWFQGALLALIGDTPANNRIGGYKESVSKAYRLCRQCLATHEVIQLTVKIATSVVTGIIIMLKIVCGRRIHLAH